MTVQRSVFGTASGQRAEPSSDDSVAARADVPVEVVGEIVHDIRNVLALVDAALGMAERKADAEDVLRFITGGRDGIRQGVELTNRLLTAMKSGRFEARPANVNALLRTLDRLFACDAKSQARVVMELASDIPECLIDPAQFNAAISNLVLNAREASPCDGTVTITTDRYIALDERLAPIVEEPYVRIRIADHGRGLAPEMVPRIFEPFFTTKGARGTGLGLAQVHAFMQQVEGNLNVITDLGSGTTFELLIPGAQRDL